MSVTYERRISSVVSLLFLRGHGFQKYVKDGTAIESRFDTRPLSIGTKPFTDIMQGRDPESQHTIIERKQIC